MTGTTSYAIVESGGKQYRAEKGASLVVEHLPADEGAKVSLRAVMYRGDTTVVLEGSELEKVKVEAVVAEHLRGPKVRVFKYKPKKGYRRHGGHRQELTRLEVTDVRLLTRKPAAKPEAKPAEKAEAKPAEKAEAKPAEKAEAKPTPAAKPAARKPAAKKPAAKKPAAKKPAAKKPAARKPATRKTTARRPSSAKKDG
jgi:large subunit ribosomal protein L21